MTPSPDLLDLPLASILEPEHELRKEYDYDALRELADSIATVGLKQPIGVIPTGDGSTYRRVWGGRRLAAHRLLGKRTIRALIVPPDEDCLSTAVAENLHRADLTPPEEARAITLALTAGRTLRELALLWRKSESWLKARLDLLEWPHDIQDALHAGTLRLAPAEYLARIDNDPYRAYLLDAAISSGATAALTRQWWAEYEANRPRIIQNQAVVEELKQKVGRYTVMVTCDGCETSTDTTTMRTYRVCKQCADQVEQQRSTP